MRASLCVSALMLTVVSVPSGALHQGIRFRAYAEARNAWSGMSRVSNLTFDTIAVLSIAAVRRMPRPRFESRAGDMPLATGYAGGEIRSEANYIPTGGVVSVSTMDPRVFPVRVGA